jgi:hypothetical protein
VQAMGEVLEGGGLSPAGEVLEEMPPAFTWSTVPNADLGGSRV